MAFDVRSYDLDVINALTRYPSIPTYHGIDPRSRRLREETVEFAGTVIGTEKIDGTNARIVSVAGGGYLIGARDELLYASGDVIGNPLLGIARTLRPVAEALRPVEGDAIRVHYLEVFGGKITPGNRQYTGTGRIGHRLLDVAVLTPATAMLHWSLDRVETWRADGGQRYLAEDELERTATRDRLELAPRLFSLDAADLPREIDKTCQFLYDYLPRTRSQLDDGGVAQAEGVVLRSPDRARVAAARFQDYDRTLRRRCQPVPLTAAA